MERSLVPINEVRNNQLQVDLELPGFVKSNKIGIDVVGVLDIIETANVDGLLIGGNCQGQVHTLVLEYNLRGDLSEDVIKSALVYPDGVQRTYTPWIGIDGEIYHELSRVHMGINIDLSKAQQAIQKEGNRWSNGVRSESAWANHINDKLQSKLFQLSVIHLGFKVPSDVIFSRSLSPLVRPFSLPKVVQQIFSGPLVGVI